MNERIAVMLGGTSSEREVSIKSGKAVARALEQAGHDVVKCLLDSDDLSALDGHDVDAVFVAMHGRFGEDGGIQALLEEAGIAYTGCGPHASARAMDKVVSKECFVEAGLPVARFTSVTAGYARDKVETFVDAVGAPVVVKPIAEGSSVGVTIVKERGEVHEAIQATFEYGADVMVEEFIEGREITVGILGGRALPIVEILPRGGFFDYTSKYVKGQSEYITGPKLPGEVTRAVQEAALAAHYALGCRDFSRVDMILSHHEPVVLEVNTIPGFTETSLLPMAAAGAHIAFPTLCSEIVQMAVKRGAVTTKKLQARVYV